MQEIAQGMESVDTSIKDLKGDVAGATGVAESVNLAAHRTIRRLDSRSKRVLNCAIAVAGAMMRSAASSKMPNVTVVVRWATSPAFSKPQDPSC